MQGNGGAIVFPGDAFRLPFTSFRADLALRSGAWKKACLGLDGQWKAKLEDKDMFEPLPEEVEVMFKLAMNKNASIEELKDTDFKPTGHGGSHPYLVHEFVSTVYEGRQSVINPWVAARFMTMGVMAHKSALKDGETLSVPDWGLPKD